MMSHCLCGVVMSFSVVFLWSPGWLGSMCMWSPLFLFMFLYLLKRLLNNTVFQSQLNIILKWHLQKATFDLVLSRKFLLVPVSHFRTPVKNQMGFFHQHEDIEIHSPMRLLIASSGHIWLCTVNNLCCWLLDNCFHVEPMKWLSDHCLATRGCWLHCINSWLSWGSISTEPESLWWTAVFQIWILLQRSSKVCCCQSLRNADFYLCTIIWLVYWHHVMGFNEHLILLCFFVRYHSIIHCSDFHWLLCELDQSWTEATIKGRICPLSLLLQKVCTNIHCSAPTVKALPLKLG